MGKFIWSLPGNADSIDVSSYGPGGYKSFSPFCSMPGQFSIPVPGNEKILSDSVEGIWQGLKIIEGKTDYSLFKGKPRKREGRPTGHEFGDVVLGYVDARKRIYIPAYAYHAINNVLDRVCNDLEERLLHGNVQFCDVEKNSDVEDTSSPLSHAAVLVDILNVLLEAPLPPFSKTSYACLQEQLHAFLEFYECTSPNKQFLLNDIITFAYLFSPHDLKQTFALRAIHAGIPEDSRLKFYAPNQVTQDIYDQLAR